MKKETSASFGIARRPRLRPVDFSSRSRQVEQEHTSLEWPMAHVTTKL